MTAPLLTVAEATGYARTSTHADVMRFIAALAPLADRMSVSSMGVPAEGREGWLLTLIARQTGPDDFEFECWIIDGGNVAAGPVARVVIPRRQRFQIHGWWASAASLARAAA